MNKTYREALIDPSISFNKIIEGQSIPEYLYKYQSFYSKDMKENKYWKENIRGAFHLSLGSEFEDVNDCKPYMDKEEICKIIEDFFQNCNQNSVTEEQLKTIHTSLCGVLTQEYFDGVISNHQNEIRIGCFTILSDNVTMWEKYANNETGFCLQYSTKRNNLFMNSTLPVLYSEKPYNSSLLLANQIILESCRKAKKRSQKEQLEIYRPIYEKILKTAYIHVFIKEKIKWEFEQEYRMFLLKNRNTQTGMLRAEEILDKNSNIDLANAITAVYLGEKFDENINHDVIKKEIIHIAKEMKIRVFQKRCIDGIYTNENII
ncbi:DUF2971 domain-containing protein [Clostridium tyrobutyricum]|uniref:DUF2971 domain-containing protein n=1 Tax=Clostridium tyrobutyricum TaxID=1519 RepID=UPI001C383565|nr:DUF2971 domain-containing protein [Clostridium tyrobutyricum]MBV4450936.1 DUF2971 domain-containing protein [Clostridium tyrobutyricum]